MVPEGLFYTEEHEWIRLEGEEALIGITDHAQEQLGDIVFVEPPEVGTDMDAGDTMATVESVKAASEIYCPVAGTVAEVNEELSDSPGKINKDAYGDGWIVKLSGVKAPEVSKLMDAAAYDELISAEGE